MVDKLPAILSPEAQAAIARAGAANTVREAYERDIEDLLGGDINIRPSRSVIRDQEQAVAALDAQQRLGSVQAIGVGDPGPFMHEPSTVAPEPDLTAIINEYMANNGSLLSDRRQSPGPLSGNSLAANSITDGVRAHRGLLTILGEKLGFEGNDWSGGFRGALSLDEPAVEGMRQIAANLSRVQPRFTDTALSEWARASNITTDRQIAGAAAAAEAGLKSGKLSVEAYEAETARIEAGRNKLTAEGASLTGDYDTWGSAVDQLRSLQDFVVGQKGEFTGGGSRFIGRGIGLFLSAFGIDPGPSEEDNYKRLKARLVATLSSLRGKEIWDERLTKQTVKQVVNRIFPGGGVFTRDTEVLEALDGMLQMAEREKDSIGNQLAYFEMADYPGFAASRDAKRRQNPGGLVSVVLDNPNTTP